MNESEPKYLTEGPILGNSKLNIYPFSNFTTELSVVANHSSILLALLYCAATLNNPIDTVAGA